MRISVKWGGIKELTDRLDMMSRDVEHATAEGVHRGAEIVQEAARANTLAVFRQWTGDLSDSIHVDGPTQVGPGAYRARAYPTIVYGRIQELGGEIVAHNPTGRLWFEGRSHEGRFGLLNVESVTLKPHPYLRPALETSIPAMRDAISGAWAQALGV